MLLAVVGLLGASMGGATSSIARCHLASGQSACAAAIMETDTPEPTVHHHIDFDGRVWDNAVGTPLPRAWVGISACGGYTYQATTAAGYYTTNWLPTEGEFSCRVVPYEVSAKGHTTVRQSVPWTTSDRDFVLARLPVSVLFLPHAGVNHAALR
jgi:hypothetical protein